jgi:hypothetical protein
MSEQSPQANSQPEAQTPQSHERSMEDRIMNLLEPKQANQEPQKPEAQEPVEASAEPEANSDPEGQPETQEGTEPEIPEVVETEYEGKTYKVPAEIKDALLRQKDYTVKTQEAAEIRKNAESVLQQAQQVLELQKAMAPQLGQLHALDEQIAQYEKVDWNTLTAQDSQRAQSLFIAFQQAKDARQKVQQSLGQLHTQQMEAVQKARQAKLEEGHKALTTHIKGWNQELGQKIMEHANKAYGAPIEVLATVTEPWAVRALHDAMQWRALQATKSVVEKKAPPQPKTLKPQASEARTPQQQGYDADRRALKSAKTDSDRSKAAERLIMRKLG